MKATLRTTRIFQAISFITLIGLATTFIVEIRSINANPPAYLFAGLIITSIATLYCLVTCVILPRKNTRPWLILFCTVIDVLFLAAVILAAVVIGRPISYLRCAGVPSITALKRRGASQSDAESAYILATRLHEYLTHADADVGYEDGYWDGASGSWRTCLEGRAVWGVDLGLCVLFLCSTVCCGYLWRKQRFVAAGLQKLDDE